jgi:hypothetical protein
MTFYQLNEYNHRFLNKTGSIKSGSLRWQKPESMTVSESRKKSDTGSLLSAVKTDAILQSIFAGSDHALDQ